ncbi:MAG: sensor histidine kinase [Anaerolineae bacterium]
MVDTRLNENQPETPTSTNTGWGQIWQVIWALTFIVSLIGSVQTATSQAAYQMILLAGVMAITQVAVVWGKRQSMSAAERSTLYLVLYTVQVILWVALVFSSPYWLIHLFSVFVHVHLNLERRLALGLDMLLFFGVLLQQIEFFGFTFLNLGIFVVLSTIAYLFGLWIYNIISDREEKRRLLLDLQAAQAELVSAERREGVLEERGRLSRDIHDTLAQGYIGVIMHLEAADEVQSGDPQKASFHLKQAQEMAREGLRQAREVVHDLRPDILEDSQGPADALRSLLERWSMQSGVSSDLSESGTAGPIHPETELTVLRVTQEGLANIAKHAQATSVQVTVSWIGDQLVLDIEDNGVGFAGETTADDEIDPDQFKDGGFGLTSMRERVESSGGELHIESIKNEGTTLTAILPVRQA